ncbi:MAG: TIGR03016 family PEP-CTERM system-associated outer membrane protein [Alphaproteobacteria bacterium]|nr:TIGR03016 family PEP-CTERM system-associated outer membrane protein [Alphaproteobacteria bacterium]
MVSKMDQGGRIRRADGLVRQAGSGGAIRLAGFASSALWLVLVLLAPAPALGQSEDVVTPPPPSQPSWIIVPRIDIQQSFTDNALRERPGRERSDTFTTIRPGVNIAHQSARHRFNMDYALTRVQYARFTEENEFRHALRQTSQLELINEALFLDLRSAISQVTVDSGGQVSADEENSSNNQRTVATFAASPYWRYRLGRWANSELRYSFNYVDFITATQQDSLSHRVTETLSYGSEFTRLLWALTLDGSEGRFSSSSAQGSRRVSTRLAELSSEYVINQYVSALASVGYERIEDRTLDDEPDGVIWTVGGKLRPGPRSAFSMVYGKRYERDYWSGSASYLIGPTSRIDAEYTRSLNTTQGLTTENLTFLGLDEFGDLIDRRTAQRLSLSDPSFNVSSNAFRRDRAQIRGNTQIGRSSFTGLAFQETRRTDATDEKREVLGASFNFGRQIWPMTRISATLRYTHTDYNDAASREDDVYSGSISLSHQFGASLVGSISYTYFNRDSNDRNSDLRENLVTVGLRKSF